MFLLVPAYAGCPGSKAVKRLLLLLLHYQSARLAVALVTLGRDLIAIVIDFVLTVFTIREISQHVSRCRVYRAPAPVLANRCA